MQEGQPLSTGCVQSGSDLMRESQQHSSKEKEDARDPDPDVESSTGCLE